MKSTTRIEYNNPNICIKGMSTFACVCSKCMEENKRLMELFVEELTKLKPIE